MSTSSQLQVHTVTKEKSSPFSWWMMENSGGRWMFSIHATSPFGDKIPPHMPQICFIEQTGDKTTKRKYQPIRELMKKILQMGIQHTEIWLETFEHDRLLQDAVKKSSGKRREQSMPIICYYIRKWKAYSNFQ